MKQTTYTQRSVQWSEEMNFWAGFFSLSEIGFRNATRHVCSSSKRTALQWAEYKNILGSLKVTSELTLKKSCCSVLTVKPCLSFVSLFTVSSLSYPAGPSAISILPSTARTNFSPRAHRSANKSHTAPSLLTVTPCVEQDELHQEATIHNQK